MNVGTRVQIVVDGDGPPLGWTGHVTATDGTRLGRVDWFPPVGRCHTLGWMVALSRLDAVESPARQVVS